MQPDTQPIIVFDGVCNLCNRAVRFILRHDSAGRFRFAARQQPAGRRLLAGQGLDPDRVDSIVLIESGRSYTRSEAVRRIAAGLGRPWRWLAAMGRLVPRALGDPLYRWIAQHRYRWFGRREQCATPPPELAHRFYEQSLEDDAGGA